MFFCTIDKTPYLIISHHHIDVFGSEKMNMRTRNFAILLVVTLTLSVGAYSVSFVHAPAVSRAHFLIAEEQ
jgi:hypothetical protein